MFYSTKCALLQKFSSLHHSSIASMTLPTNTTLPLPSNEGCGHGSLILKDIQQVWASRKSEGQDCERLEAGKLNASVCSQCVIIGYWQSWFASTTTTISPMESQEARPNAHDKKMTNALRPSTHEHNMHVHDMWSLCPLHLLLNAHWAKLGGLTIRIRTLCQHEPPIQTCTQTCGWNVSTNMNAAHHHTNDEWSTCDILTPHHWI
jgi:hypothetical protein